MKGISYLYRYLVHVCVLFFLNPPRADVSADKETKEVAMDEGPMF